MHKKLVIVLIGGIIALMVLIGVQLFPFNTKPETTDTSNPGTVGSKPRPHVVNTITSRSGAAYSAVPIIENSHTTLVTTDLYKNTISSSQYSIFFNNKDGGGIILLYVENLNAARKAGEKQLLEILPNTQGEICDMDILVQTNEYVNKAYSGRNLGLSFCPNSVTLP